MNDWGASRGLFDFSKHSRYKLTVLPTHFSVGADVCQQSREDHLFLYRFGYQRTLKKPVSSKEFDSKNHKRIGFLFLFVFLLVIFVFEPQLKNSHEVSFPLPSFYDSFLPYDKNLFFSISWPAMSCRLFACACVLRFCVGVTGKLTMQSFSLRFILIRSVLCPVHIRLTERR